MLKNQVERPGRRSISSCAARDSTAPPRAHPRSAGPAQSQTLVTVTTWPLVWVNRGSVCVFVQEPRHLQYVADLDDLNVYTVVNSRKLYGAPTDFTFCIKVSFFTPRQGKRMQGFSTISTTAKTLFSTTWKEALLMLHNKSIPRSVNGSIKLKSDKPDRTAEMVTGCKWPSDHGQPGSVEKPTEWFFCMMISCLFSHLFHLAFLLPV